jgi:hypothetical protein
MEAVSSSETSVNLTGLHGVTSQNVSFIVAAVRTSDRTSRNFFLAFFPRNKPRMCRLGDALMCGFQRAPHVYRNSETVDA